MPTSGKDTGAADLSRTEDGKSTNMNKLETVQLKGIRKVNDEE